MGKKYKVIVAHSAQQHSFKTAVALKEAGYLYRYITTVYDKKNSLTGISKKFLKGDNLKRANTRKCEEIEDKEVLQFYEMLGLVLLVLQRVDKSKIFYNLMNDFINYIFHVKVAKYAIKHDVDAVIVYDTLGYQALKMLKKKAPNIKRVIDMSAPNMIYMDKIFREDIDKELLYSDDLKKEVNSSRYKKTIEKVKDELILSEYFLVASEFTRISLNDNGICNEQIFKCPYGIDFNKYKSIIERNSSSSKIKVIFIGNVTQKKGIIHLLKAIKRLNISEYSLDILGNYDSNTKYYKEYKDIVNFHGHVTKDKVIEICSKSDVIIFPSLADGYGLSVLEALACGTPAICSKNAGVSELIKDNYNGFKIDPGNSDVIYEKLEYINNNKWIIREMNKNARDTAKNQTWEYYNKCIKESIETILNNK